MKRLGITGLILVLAWSTPALAEEPSAGNEPRVHVTAGGARALGGDQSSEFGLGGAAAGTLEIPATARLGLQTTAAAVVLGKGDPPKDATLAPTKTGAAFMGTVGVRLRAFGATRVAGPWMDSNVGISHTGDVTRPAFDAHLGWDIRVSKSSRLDVGPFVGYTQIFQPDSELRSSDARILTAGISIGFGAKERARPAEPIGPEKSTPLPTMEDHDAMAEAYDVCADGSIPKDDGCNGEVRIFEDRITLDDVVHFDFDSARIRDESRGLVRKVARFLIARTDIVETHIEGHADEVGTDAYNQKLSEARARSMRDLLVSFGVDASRLQLFAHGKSRPKIVTLRREVENRRVEMYVVLQRQESGGVASSQGRNSK